MLAPICALCNECVIVPFLFAGATGTSPSSQLERFKRHRQKTGQRDLEKSMHQVGCFTKSLSGKVTLSVYYK